MKKGKIKKILLITLVPIICGSLYAGGLYYYKEKAKKACEEQSAYLKQVFTEQLYNYVESCNLKIRVSTELEKVDYTFINMNLVSTITLDSTEHLYNLQLESFYKGWIGLHKKDEQKMLEAPINKQCEEDFAQAIAELQLEGKMNSYTEHELDARRIAHLKIANKLEVQDYELAFDESSLTISHYNPYSSTYPNGIIIEERFTKGNIEYYSNVMLKFNKDYSRYKVADCSVYQY